MPQCVQCGRRMPGFTFGKKICQWCVQHEAARRAEASGVEQNAVQHVMAPPWLSHRRTLPVSISKIFVGINVAVFLAMVLAGISLTDPTSQQLLHWGANYGPLTFGGEWWRLLTSCFVHAGIIHLGFNMWCLWDLGALAEMLYGPWTFVGIYLVSGVASMVASAGWHFSGPSVGASGAIFGLAGALAASLYLGEFSLPRNAIMGQFRSLILFVVYNLLFGAVAGQIDNAAHIGGLVSGSILGALVARAAPQRELWARRLAILGVALAIVVASAAALGRSHAYLVHALRGNDFLDNKKPAQAIPELQSALRLRPSYLPARFALAEAYWDQEQWPQVETELQRIIELQPKNENAYYNLSRAYLNEGRPEQARATVMKLLELDPQSGAAHRGLADVYFSQKDYAAALKEYQAAAEVSSGDQGLFYEMGQSYAKLGDFNNAIAAYQREIQISGEASETEAALAEAYRATGQIQEAEAAEKKVVKGTTAGSKP